MIKNYIVVGSGSAVRRFFDINEYLGNDYYVLFLEEDANSHFPNDYSVGINTRINGNKLVKQTSSSWCGNYSCNDLNKYSWDSYAGKNQLKSFDDLPNIDINKYEGIVVLNGASNLISLALYKYYDCKLKIYMYDQTDERYISFNSLDSVIKSSIMRDNFINIVIKNSWNMDTRLELNKIKSLIGEQGLEVVKENIKYYTDLLLKDDKFISSTVSYTSVSDYNNTLKCLSSFIYNYLIHIDDTQEYAVNFVNEVYNKFVKESINYNINNNRISKSSVNPYLVITSIMIPDVVKEAIINKDMEIFETRPQTMNELLNALYFHNADVKYTLSDKQSKAIVKILNRNKANKNLTKIVNICKDIFEDSLNWDTVDEIIKDKVFTEPTTIGKYKVGPTEEVKEEQDEIIKSELEDIARGFTDKEYLVTPLVTLTYIVLAPKEEIKGNLRVLAVDLFGYLSNHYTATGGTDYTLYRSIARLKKEDGKLFKDDTMQMLLDELFKIIRKDNRKIMYKKFYIMVNDLGLEYLCTNEMYTKDKTYKKVKMEAKMDN